MLTPSSWRGGTSSRRRSVGRSVRGGHRELESSPPPIASTRYSPCTERPSKERGAVGKGGPSKRRTDGRPDFLPPLPCPTSPSLPASETATAAAATTTKTGGRRRTRETGRSVKRAAARQAEEKAVEYVGGLPPEERDGRRTHPEGGREAKGKRKKEPREEEEEEEAKQGCLLSSFLVVVSPLSFLLLRRFVPPLPPLLHSALLLSSHPHSSSSIPSIQPFLLSYRTWTSQTWSPASPRTATGAATAEEWGERAGDSSGSNKHLFVPDLSLSTQSVRVTRVGGVRRLWLPASWPPRPERVVAATKTKRVGVAPPEGWRRKGRTEDFFVHRGKERKGWRRLRWRKRKWWLHPSPYRRESLSN